MICKYSLIEVIGLHGSKYTVINKLAYNSHILKLIFYHIWFKDTKYFRSDMNVGYRRSIQKVPDKQLCTRAFML